MHMYCAHQQWLLASEIDYSFGFWREGDFLLVKAKIARDRSRAEVVQEPLRPFQSVARVGMKNDSLLCCTMTRARVPPDSLLRTSHKAVSFFVLAAFIFHYCCIHFSFLLCSFFILAAFIFHFCCVHFLFLLRSFFILSAFNSFDIQLNQI